MLNLAHATRRFESRHIDRVLEMCEGDKRDAAKRMGLSLSTLYRKLEAIREIA